VRIVAEGLHLGERARKLLARSGLVEPKVAGRDVARFYATRIVPDPRSSRALRDGRRARAPSAPAADVWPEEENLLLVQFPHDLLSRRGVDAFIEFVAAVASSHPFGSGVAGYGFHQL
jgi:hypothetical protein